MDRPGANLDPSYSVTEFFYLSACGEEARRWLAEFEGPDNLELRLDLLQTLRHLRAQQISAGATLLAGIESRLSTREPGSESVDRFLWRYFFAARAYLEYLQGDLESTLSSLADADDGIRWLISRKGFLLPLAVHCTDFIIQRARVARRAGDWEGVQRHLWTLRSVCEGTQPYCVLGPGRSVGQHDLKKFFAALDLDDRQKIQAERFLHGDLSAAETTARIAERIFALPDMVIPYP